MSDTGQGPSVAFWDPALAEIDARIATTPAAEIPNLLREIPLDVFALLQLARPDGLPNLCRFLPIMPPGEVQQSWNGAQGRELLRMSVDFMTRVVARYQSEAAVPLARSAVLDFGCGWGRLLRLMYKYVPQDLLYGVDPWDQSLELCTECGLRGNLAQSDYVPRDLPFDRQFDLIYAFSVLTHLSKKTTHRVLATLREHISDAGWLFVTIRPEEYWHYHEGGAQAAARIATHHREGFCFVPHDREPIDGDVTYGDTTFTLEWLERAVRDDWIIDSTDYCMGDLLQIMVALRPR